MNQPVDCALFPIKKLTPPWAVTRTNSPPLITFLTVTGAIAIQIPSPKTMAFLLWVNFPISRNIQAAQPIANGTKRSRFGLPSMARPIDTPHRNSKRF